MTPASTCMPGPRRGRGFILLPVVLTLSLLASVAYLAGRDSGSNVAMVVDRSDREKARYAAEAGLQHATYVLQQRSCLGPYPQLAVGPVANNAFGGATYNAYADRASGSPVVLTSTGSYNGASVTLSRSNVTVYQTGARSFVVQPDSVGGKDTTVSGINPTTNYGADNRLRLLSTSYQPLLQFDFLALPPGSRPVALYNGVALVPGAQMSLYQTQLLSIGSTVNTQLVTKSWVGGRGPAGSTGATWNTADGVTPWPGPGSGYAQTPVASQTSPGVAGWENVDLSDAVIGWMSGAVANNGVWLLNPSGSGELRYVSSDESVNTTQRPKMTLNYLLPCGTAAPTRVTLPVTRDTDIDSSHPDDQNADAIRIAVAATKVFRALLTFNTATIPASSIVSTATLRLYLVDVKPGAAFTTSAPLTLTVNAMINQTWAADATWNKRSKSGGGVQDWLPAPGGTFRAAIAGSTSLPQGFSQGNWVEFDITSLAKEWIDGTTPNLGLIVRNSTVITDELRFTSSDASGGNGPQLVVTYR